MFRLAAGLESRILGEDQIITQVKDALALARENYAADNVLEVLFRMAVTAAKRVKDGGGPYRSQSFRDPSGTGYSERDRDFLYKGRKCMVIGNGAMGKLTASTLLVRRGGCDRYRASVPERYRGHSLRLPAGSTTASAWGIFRPAIWWSVPRRARISP